MSGRARPVRIGGHAIFADDEQPTFWDRVEAGAWEPGTLRVLDDLLGPGALFIDIGAWVGALTLYAASLGAEVVALEADPTALGQLRRNLAANPGLARRVRLVPRALAAEGGSVRMGARRKPGDSMSSVLLADGGEAWIAPAIGPEELASQLSPQGADLVKLDIEGGEYALLPALAPVLERSGALLLALHPDLFRDAGGDPAAAARNIPDMMTGWSVARVGPGGLSPARWSDIPDTGPAEWLFRNPEHPAGPPGLDFSRVPPPA